MKIYTAMIPQYVSLGRSDHNWYPECKRTLTEIFPGEDLWLICQLLAATSIHTSLKANIVLFRKALYMYHNNIPFNGFVPVMVKQLVSLKAGGSLSGRKISNFARAMYGDPSAVVVDTWILRAFAVNKKRKFRDRIIDASASKKQYDAIEKWIIKRAYKLGYSPAHYCSMIWAGVRRSKGYLNEPTRYCDFLRYHFQLQLSLFENGK